MSNFVRAFNDGNTKIVGYVGYANPDVRFEKVLGLASLGVGALGLATGFFGPPSLGLVALLAPLPTVMYGGSVVAQAASTRTLAADGQEVKGVGAFMKRVATFANPFKPAP